MTSLARTRSRRTARSNSANTGSSVAMARPGGVVRSSRPSSDQHLSLA
jgi:hypothetical protein